MQRSISLSDHCPIRLSQGSETVFRRRLCRSFSISYGFNHHCHGRGRGFESRRPRHSFQALARNWQFASWSNLVQLGLFPPGLSTRRTGLLRASLLFGLRKKIQRNATVGMTWELLYHIHFLFLVVLTQQSCVGVNVDGLPLYTLTRICSAEYTKRVESSNDPSPILPS